MASRPPTRPGVAGMVDDLLRQKAELRREAVDLRRQRAARRGERAVPEGLRERKKRLMRQLISDTATRMFLDDGFEAVRVADVAAAAGVSEKTVYNYFPTKESLILDRFEDIETDVRAALGPGAPPGSPVEAVVAVIVADLRRQFETDADGAEPFDAALPRRFVELVRQTPALLSAQLEMMERVIQVAAEAMAARAAVDPGDPEPQIAAHALAGLWQVQLQAMHRYADGTRSGAEVRDAVIADVRRAARLIDTGLWSFGLAVQGSSSGEAVRLAAEAANDARRQVAAALRQARTAWRQVVTEAHPPHGGRHGPPPGGHRNR